MQTVTWFLPWCTQLEMEIAFLSVLLHVTLFAKLFVLHVVQRRLSGINTVRCFFDVISQQSRHVWYDISFVIRLYLYLQFIKHSIRFKANGYNKRIEDSRLTAAAGKKSYVSMDSDLVLFRTMVTGSFRAQTFFSFRLISFARTKTPLSPLVNEGFVSSDEL